MRATGLLAFGVLLGVLAPAALAFHPPDLPDGDLLSVELDPEPVPADSLFVVRAAFSEASNATSVRLKYCLSENRNATLCFPTIGMRREGSTWSALTEHPIPGEQEFGINLTILHEDGARRYYPSGNHTLGNAYVFYRTLPREGNFAPLPPFVAALALVLAGAVVSRRDR